MILSFHPVYEGAQNRLCAGRDPDAADLAAMRQAAAIILPQVCRRSLYEAARQHCATVFPNYAARFTYPGKVGQTRLFREMGVAHPRTVPYADTGVFFKRHPDGKGPFPPPAVVKMNWGGEGEGVFPIRRAGDLKGVLQRLRDCERTGQRGFVFQEWIPAGARSLRVVVSGHRMKSYWRIVPKEALPLASLARGGTIDRTSDPHLMEAAQRATRTFCRKTGINLAGFDFLFSTDPTIADPATPLFLEINYYFGRRGFQGSEAYYRWLIASIDNWLKSKGIKRDKREGALSS
jgi:ribosomal protein S6--L-glutamate ligase